MHDIVNNLTISQVLAPQVIQAAALDSGNIDMQGHEILAVAVLVGNIVDTLDADNRIDVKIEHADATDAYTACTDEDVLNFTGLSSGTFLAIDAAGKESKRHVIGYRGGKRYVKVTATPVSMSTGGPIAMVAIKGNASAAPVTNT
ncbi:MAG: hypothetical protein ACAH80_04685 [Alphaproteobacteria bacterium]